MLSGVIAAGDGESAQTRGSWAPVSAALAPIANRTLLACAIDTLAAAGADEITVVSDRDAAPRLRSAITTNGGPVVRWLPCPEPCDPGSALLAVAEASGADRFLLHTTEGLWLRHTAAALRALAEGDNDALLLLRHVGATVPAAVAESRYSRAVAVATEAQPVPVALAGLHGFSAAIVDPLRDTDSEAGDRRLLDAIDALAESGGRVEATMGDGWWSYSGRADELLEANRIVLDALEGDVPDAVRARNRVEGRVSIDPSAQINGSFIRGPATIGAHATITDTYIGPYTSVGEAVTLDNVEIESSLILTGARMRNIPCRVESSIIGLGASVGRGFELPRAMRIVVGEDARVALA